MGDLIYIRSKYIIFYKIIFSNIILFIVVLYFEAKIYTICIIFVNRVRCYSFTNLVDTNQDIVNEIDIVFGFGLSLDLDFQIQDIDIAIFNSYPA